MKHQTVYTVTINHSQDPGAALEESVKHALYHQAYDATVDSVNWGERYVDVDFQVTS